MKRSIFANCIMLICLWVGLCAHPCPSFSSETDLQPEHELDWIIRKIKEREDSLKTFTAKFIQIKKTRLLQEPLRSEGLIYFDRTGKMLWKVTKPSLLIVLITNDRLFVDYPDLSKTRKISLSKGGDVLKEYFGIGQSTKQLKKQYEIALVTKTDIDTCRLKLTPKRKAIAKHIETIEVVINKNSWLPEQIHFKEVKGDYTSLSLYFTVINKGLPVGIFSLPSAEDQRNDSQILHEKGEQQ